VLGFPPILVIVYLVSYVVVGMVIGLLSGWLTSLLTKCRPQGIWKNGLLGSIGFQAGFIGTMLMPWHENTVTEKLDGGGTVTTTMSRYQHPERIAIIIAVLLPLARELYRVWRARHGRSVC
jgi:uncharacterized membrane protein YeaQ/YmgE (transglycosylase-associated protein family)